VLACVVLGLVVAEHGDGEALVLRGEEFSVIVCVLTVLLGLAHAAALALAPLARAAADCRCALQVSSASPQFASV